MLTATYVIAIGSDKLKLPQNTINFLIKKRNKLMSLQRIMKSLFELRKKTGLSIDQCMAMNDFS